ncbi:twin-arginine translocase subunit TatC [Cohnella sp.]|uniref:twin-arginine translocase subunit TatC n=1 Tax=Cohnella sp. TaxID=1883426 RepID=UPI0037036ED0
MKEKEMKLSLHLAELRKRVFRIVAVLVVTMVGGLLTANDVLAYLRSVKPADAVSWHVFSPWDSIRLYMQIAFIVSVGLSMPVILYQLWAFVKPGLREEERSATFRYIPLTALLFLAGLGFAYFVVFQSAFHFAGMLNKRMNVTETYGAAQYFSFMFSILLPVSLIFELPALLMFLTKLRMLKPGLLRKFRRHAYFGLIVVSTFIAPPDFLSNILIAIPLILLYELSVLLSARIYRKQMERDLAFLNKTRICPRG